MIKQLLTSILFLLVVSCGPSEFEYINAPDKNQALDDANTANQQQVTVNEGFRFEATPNPARVGQSVTFVASCKLGEGKVIEFDFGDGSAKEQGATLKHAYQKEGTYRVKATCSLDGEEPLRAEAIIQISNELGPAQM